MGRSVEELLRTVSEGEIAEWAAYAEVEPFGSPADDGRFASLCALTYQAHTPAGTPQPDWFDRAPDETARRRAMVRNTDEDIISILRGHNAKRKEED